MPIDARPPLVALMGPTASGKTALAVAWAQQLAEADRATMDRWTGPLDAVEVTSAEGTKTALGIISLGIDATANWVGNHSWLRSGPLAYAWGALVGFAGGFKPGPIEARIDGRATELGGWLTSVSNTGWFGGGVNILPQSRADDGTLEIINVEKMSRLRALPLLVALWWRGKLITP